MENCNTVIVTGSAGMVGSALKKIVYDQTKREKKKTYKK